MRRRCRFFCYNCLRHGHRLKRRFIGWRTEEDHQEYLTAAKLCVDCDVLICGDRPEAKAVVQELVRKIAGARPVDAGGLENSRLVEHAAALLIALNQRHKVKHSGLRITGIPAAVSPKE